MPAQIAIVHGWSDTSKSFGNLKSFLTANGYDVAQIWLGDYVSMDDDVRVEDVAKRMQVVLKRAVERGDLTATFDMIVHSTGGLVAREWIATYYPDGASCPVRRLIMLAPANFGSRLAALGKSMIGRIAKGWNNWFQTGEEMLRSLELASPYQWRLARRDLVDPDGDGRVGPYGPTKVMPFIITGTRAYADGLKKAVNEHGSDGTVRACAANLNAVGMTIDFAASPSAPEVSIWKSRNLTEFPCAILPDKDHGAVTRPTVKSDADQVTSDLCGKLILEALACDDATTYSRMVGAWRELSDRTASLADDPNALAAMFGKKAPNPQTFHPHMQALVHVRDDHGQPVRDYFLEFFSPETKGTKDSEIFHGEVLTHVHTNTTDASFRCLFMDHADLVGRYYQAIANPDHRELAVSISAAQVGPNVRYFDSEREGAEGNHVLHRAESDSVDNPNDRLFRNRTHLIEVVIPRQPIDKVFRLSQ